jgi:hypothetical protein
MKTSVTLPALPRGGSFVGRFARKVSVAAIFFAFPFGAMAADVNCCKICCHGAQCVMTHHAAHDCVGHPPCK